MTQKNVAVVAGGTGAVGEGIVKVLASKGWSVVVPVRSQEKGTLLKERIKDQGNLHLVKVDIGKNGGSRELKEWALAKFGRIDLGIASLGGWFQGSRLDQMTRAEWQRVMDNNLNSHFFFAREMMQYFHHKNHGTYIMINGGAAEMIVPGAGAMSIIANAQLVMTQILAKEAHGTDIDVYSIMAITPVITRTRTTGEPDWISAEEIGEYSISLFTQKSQEIVHRIPKK